RHPGSMGCGQDGLKTGPPCGLIHASGSACHAIKQILRQFSKMHRSRNEIASLIAEAGLRPEACIGARRQEATRAAEGSSFEGRKGRRCCAYAALQQKRAALARAAV